MKILYFKHSENLKINMRLISSFLRREKFHFFSIIATISIVSMNYIISLERSALSNNYKLIDSTVAYKVLPISIEVDESELSDDTTKMQSDAKQDTKNYTHVVQKGDNLISVLYAAGINSRDAFVISKAINKKESLNNLQIGQELRFRFNDASNNNKSPTSLRFTLYTERNRINIHYDNSRSLYYAELLPLDIKNKTELIQGFIKSDNFYKSAADLNLPSSITRKYIHLLKHEVNFHRDIKTGNMFKILYEYQEDSEGRKFQDGQISYASLSLDNKKIEIYGYKDSNGNINYYHPDGRNLNKSFLIQPVTKARISSKYGMRTHPVHKYKRFHKGVDYAAPKGTPVFSAGDGVVHSLNIARGYGRYLIVQHNGTYKTLYAHLHKFKPGIRKGLRIKQGDIIGYIGKSGTATGPHLHYEMRKNNIPINPLKANFPIHNNLTGIKLVAFNKQKKQTDMLINNNQVTILAQADQN